MANILIVDDHPAQTQSMRELLRVGGYNCDIVTSAKSALEILEQQRSDAVLTELVLHDASGLELVERIQRCYPNVPAILITGYGNEEIAAEALMKGACSYIPKRRMQRDLLSTLQNILGLKTADRRNQRLAQCWLGGTFEFQLGNQPELVPSLVGHFQDQLATLRFGDESTLIRIGVALTETLENAIYHGNLELNSELRKGDGHAWTLAQHERRGLSPYRDRHVYVTAKLSKETIEFTIRDEGPGFDPGILPDPTDPANLENVSGRGVYLMRMLMDVVRYNERGNQVTLVKHRQRNPSTPCG